MINIINIIIILMLGFDIAINIDNHLKLKKMGENTDQALSELEELSDQLKKIGTETTATLQKVTELEDAANNADTPQAILDKIAELRAQVQKVDDLVPDA